MQKTNSKETIRKEFKNLSFKELDEFINQWTIRTGDMDKQFFNQVHDVNKMFAVVGVNDQKCKQVNRLFNVLAHFHFMMELNMSVANANMEELEHSVLCLENKNKNRDLAANRENVDPQRVKVYPCALKINEDLNEMHRVFEEILSFITEGIQKELSGIPQIIVNILGQHTEQLDNAEIKIRRIENMLQILVNKYTLLKQLEKKIKL